MADWTTIEAERFQDLHCRPDGITLTAGARVNLANTLRHIADERVKQARREVWDAAIQIAKQVAAWPNAKIAGQQVVSLLETAANKERLVCKNCGCPPPKAGEIGEWCSACGAGVEYESEKEFERRHGST